MLVRQAHTVAAEAADEMVMLDPEQGAYFRSECHGPAYLGALDTSQTPGVLRDRLVTEFDVTPESCLDDVVCFVSQLADGSLVTAVVSSMADAEIFAGWLYGSVMALTAVHQGRFALHASLVSLSGTGIAVGGPSGAGKSTLTLRLAQRGARLVTDDVSPVSIPRARSPVVTATGRPIHVWPTTVELIGLDATHARRCWPGTDKLSLDLPGAGEHCLDVLVVIGCEGWSPPRLERLSGAEAVGTLLQQTYRHELLDARWLAAHLAWAQDLARRVPVYALTRPLEGNSVDRLAQCVEALAAELQGTA